MLFMKFKYCMRKLYSEKDVLLYAHDSKKRTYYVYYKSVGFVVIDKYILEHGNFVFVGMYTFTDCEIVHSKGVC